ncbi:MAG: hydroxymethylbilane synthase [Armatimonadetes bacterium]|nr:hydroxymethylbilane synthase [Armatimonadota bacterium]
MKVTTLRLGTRGSALALWQSRWVASRLESSGDLRVDLVVIRTAGDKEQDAPLSSLGGKGLFTREIEIALLAGVVDFAVHSLKDLPTELPPGLTLSAFPRREDPRDVLIASVPLDALAPGAVVGTGSLRRQCQLQAARPDLVFRDIRGNVTTRIEKWRSGEYDAVVLAMAGVRRLGPETTGLREEELHALEPELCAPAPCQGILGLECRESDTATLGWLSRLSDPATEVEARAERSFLKKLGGGCNLPAGALARAGKLVELRAVLRTSRGLASVELRGGPEKAASLGRQAAAHLLSLG